MPTAVRTEINRYLTNGFSVAASSGARSAFMARRADGSETGWIIYQPTVSSGGNMFSLAAFRKGAEEMRPDPMQHLGGAESRMIAANVSASQMGSIELRSGTLSFGEGAEISAGQGEFPYSLSFSRSYNSTGPVEGRGDMGSGWTHNWDSTSSRSSDVRALIPDAEAVSGAPTLLAAMIALEAGRRNTIEAHVIAGAVMNWWQDQGRHNVIAVNGGGSSARFVRLANGTWRNPASPAEQLTILANWDFDRRLADQSVQKFRHIALQPGMPGYGSGTGTGRTAMTEWSFPSGVVITLTYAGQDGTNSAMLASVSNNLGVTLNFAHSSNPTVNQTNNCNSTANTYVDEWLRRSAIQECYRLTRAGGRLTQVSAGADQINFTYNDLCPINTNYCAFTLVGANRPGLRARTYHYSIPDGSAPIGTGDGLTYQPMLAQVTDAGVTVPRARFTWTGVGSQVAPQVTESFDALERRTRYFSTGDSLASVTNALDQTTRQTYDGDGRLIGVTDAMGRTSHQSHDGAGRTASVRTAWGDVTSFGYDARGNLTQRTHTPRAGCGTDDWWCQTITVSAEYHATWNKPTRVTLPATEADPSVRHWDFTYNTKGLLTQMKGPSVLNGLTGTNAQPIWATTYDAYGRVATQTDPTGRRVSNTYGGGGLPAFCQRLQTASSQSGGLNLVTTFGCNAVGDVTSVTDARGNTTTATYDALRRRTAEVGPAGTNIQTQWTFDVNGNQTHERRWDASASTWRVTQTVYSATNQPTRVIDPEGQWTRFCHDALDRAYRVIDPSLRMRIYYWNDAGQPTETRRYYVAANNGTCGASNGRPTGVTSYRERAFEYNEGGLLSAELDANGNRTEFQYDGLGRQLVTQYADGTEAWTLLDQRGQTVIRKQRSGLRAQVFYDAVGRDYHVWEHQVGAAEWVGRNIRAAYDLAGRPVWRDVSVQPTSTWSDTHLREVRTYGYDAAGRLTTDQVRPEGNGGSNPLTLVFTYGYDAAGNRTSIEWPDAWTATYAYDAANRPTTVSFGGHTATHVWDSMSRRTALNRSNNVNTTWTYSPTSRATTMVHGFTSGSPTPTATFSYGYDDSGKITSLNANQAVFEWAPSLNYARTYGAVNNRNQVASEIQGGTTRANTFDLDGNMTSDGVNTYTWTFGNRLAGASRSGMTASYAYDGDDRRTVKVVNGVMTRTLWSGADELAETNQAGTILRRFIPDGSGGMDARLAMLSGTTINWFHTDHLGSVIAVSAANGRTTATAAYSPHGELASGVNPPGGVFGYTGRQFDPETGLYQYRARYYHPRLGQFLSTDPVGTKDDPNLYQYAGWDPVSATDPTGMCVASRINAERRSICGNSKKSATEVSQDPQRRVPSQPRQNRSPSAANDNHPPAANDNASRGRAGRGLRPGILSLPEQFRLILRNSRQGRITVYRVCDDILASCTNGRSWTPEDPREMPNWRDRLAVYPGWNQGTSLATGTITFNDLAEGRVVPSGEPGSVAGPRPFDARLGGGPYRGNGVEWIIHDPASTVEHLIVAPFND